MIKTLDREKQNLSLTFNPAETHAMQSALSAAREWQGNTAPNPPVGAAALSAKGLLLGVAAHERAGTPHAEAKLLTLAREGGWLDQIHTLLVTLEPCNHHGRTPPCTQAILQAKIPNVIYATPDPNPRVEGAGAQALAQHGVNIRRGLLEPECLALIRPFAKWSRERRPWVLVKQALDRQGSMIPPPGAKTFTSEESLRLAHLLRKQSDAILTGSGTVLADAPEFTVRRVPDFPGKKRILSLFDRRRRVGEEYLSLALSRGLIPHLAQDLAQELDFLGQNNCLQVLVEAGPSLTNFILSLDLWDELVVIRQAGSHPSHDSVERHLRTTQSCSQGSSKKPE